MTQFQRRLLKSENKRTYKYIPVEEKLYQILKKRHAQFLKRHNFEFYELDITFQEFLQFRANPCFYCSGKLPEQGCGLDRVNNYLTYSKKNVVPCCTSCNMLKGRYLSSDELKLILEFRKSKV